MKSRDSCWKADGSKPKQGQLISLPCPGSEHLQNWRSYSLSGLSSGIWPSSGWITFDIISYQNFPRCNLCLLSLVLSLHLRAQSDSAFCTPSSQGHKQQEDVPFPSLKPRLFSFLSQYMDVFLQGKPKTDHKTSSAQVHAGTTLGFTSAAHEQLQLCCTNSSLTWWVSGAPAKKAEVRELSRLVPL